MTRVCRHGPPRGVTSATAAWAQASGTAANTPAQKLPVAACRCGQRGVAIERCGQCGAVFCGHCAQVNHADCKRRIAR